MSTPFWAPPQGSHRPPYPHSRPARGLRCYALDSRGILIECCRVCVFLIITIRVFPPTMQANTLFPKFLMTVAFTRHLNFFHSDQWQLSSYFYFKFLFPWPLVRVCLLAFQIVPLLLSVYSYLWPVFLQVVCLFPMNFGSSFYIYVLILCIAISLLEWFVIWLFMVYSSVWSFSL